MINVPHKHSNHELNVIKTLLYNLATFPSKEVTLSLKTISLDKIQNFQTPTNTLKQKLKDF